MALPSKLTSPLPTVSVDNPDVAAELNKNFTRQTITNPGATATIDPTKGQVIYINTTTASTAIAMAASLQGTLQDGAIVLLLVNSSGATPALTAGTGVHAASTVTLTQNKVCVVPFIYDATTPELKQLAAPLALS